MWVSVRIQSICIVSELLCNRVSQLDDIVQGDIRDLFVQMSESKKIKKSTYATLALHSRAHLSSYCNLQDLFSHLVS